MSFTSSNLQTLCDNLINDCELYLQQGLVVNNESFRHSHTVLLKRAPTLYNMIIESVKSNNKQILERFLPVMINVLEKLENKELSQEDADKLIGEFFAKEFIPQYQNST